MESKRAEQVRLFIEVGGAVAVLLGLIFVGLELRQNTEAAQAATYQSLVDATSNHLLFMASDPEIARIMTTGHADVSALNEAEARRYFMVNRNFWVRMQNAYSQWQRGTLSDDDWTMYAAGICEVSGRPVEYAGFIQTFDQHVVGMSDAFRAFVEQCWSESGVGASSDSS